MVFLIQRINDMLFYLTDSLIVGKEDPLYNDIYKSIHNIATQVIDGNHLLRADIKVLEHFRMVYQSDPYANILFNQLYQDYATCGIPQNINFYIEIVKENPICRKENGIDICQKSYLYYLNVDVCSKAILVGEDLNDTIFFEHVLNWFIRQTGDNYRYSVHRMSGGGHNTYRVVQNELDAHHVTICIVDTDKRYPACPPEQNGTYENCVNNINTEACEYKFLPLDVHEIENLVPLNYIDSFDNWVNGNANDVRKKKAFDFLKNDAENILPYFDYKKGIKNDDMFRNEPDYRNFAEKCYGCNQDKVNLEPDFCTFVSKLADKTEIYPNLIGGTGTIKRTLDLIKTNSCPKPDLLDFQRKNWNLIGQYLLDWCIARVPESIS